MREIQLTRNQVALIDDEDFDLINQHKWFSVSPRQKNYRHTWYAACKIQGRHVTMHNLLLNPPKGSVADHIDHNGLNNRRTNIRISTTRENSWNTNKHKNCTSKFKGVSWNKEKSKWQARICINGRETHLGWFHDEVLAANTYDFVACQFFGDFAKLNFPRQMSLAGML